MSTEKTKPEGSRLITALGVLCAFCLMIVFLITAVEAVAYWTPGYYEKEYTKYQVLNDLPEMTMEDLLTVTEEMMAYLRGNREDLHVYTTMGGVHCEFFNEREIAHMEDVRGLFIGGLWLRRIGLAFTVVTLLGLWFWSKKDFERREYLKTAVPSSLCLGTGIFFAAALAIIGLVSTNFSKYFVVFHRIFFDNDLWILDPDTDMLINIVPEPFFMDTALYIALVFVCMVVLFLALNLWLCRRQKKSATHKKSKKSRTVKSMSMILCLALTFSAVSSTQAYAATSWPANTSISADGGILMDANSGTVLYGKNIHEAYYPASITKILTALVTLKNCDMDEIVTFSHTAVNTLEPGASIVGARVGDQMSVRDCLYALLLQSANEVANALAEHCSGSIEAFAELMNAEAKSLGCTDSHFANPSGLNDPEHYTSAHDMALIAQAAFADPTFVEIDSTLYYDIPAGQLQQYPNGWRYYAHHRMLKKNDSLYYAGVIGGKTGYTSLAGNTLVTCAERDGMKLIAVVLNGHQTHYSDTKTLLDFGFNNFKSVAIADKDSTYQKIENDLAIGGISLGETTKLTVDKNSVITLPADGDFADVTSTLDYNLDSTAPAGAIARIDYMYGDRIVGQAYLETSTTPGYTATSAVPENSAEAADATIAAADASAAQTAQTSASETVNAQTAETAAPATQAAKTDTAKSNKNISVLSILKTVLVVVAVIGVIGAVIFAILMHREKKEQEELMIRRQRRENRRREWGSSAEFNLTMQEHLRSKNQFKKRSFFDRFRKN